MNKMDFFLLAGLIITGLLIISFAAYSSTTNSIIKDQEKEIAALRTENHRLKNGKGYKK
jgi:hypothetical protein